MVNANREVYTVSEIQEKLALGKNKAYDLCTSGVFTYKRIGKSILIPKKAFEEWLYKPDEKLCS